MPLDEGEEPNPVVRSIALVHRLFSILARVYLPIMKPLTRASEHIDSGTEVLDGFRGLAILLVFVYHTWLFSWYTPALTLLHVSLPLDVFARTGYLGVELFFAISGFVLFFPHAERDAHDGERQSTADFAFRRTIKIVPSYLIALAVTTTSLASLHVAVPLGEVLPEHVLFVENFFSNDFGRANSVFWSLAVEVQFYLVFPALARAFRRWPFAVALAMTAAALAYRYGVADCCLLVEPVNRQLPAFLDIFAAGMLAAYGVARLRAGTTPAALDRYRPYFTLIAIAAACAAFALLHSANAIAYDVAGREKWILANRTLMALVAGTSLFASCFAVRAWRRAVANPLLVFLSLVSYNLYLWHTLVMIWLWKHHVLPSTTSNPQADDHWKFAFIVTGWTSALVISVALTYFVERPLLALVRPQSFAFDWSRLTRASAATAPETHT